MKIMFFTDAPPLDGGGPGNHGIASNLIDALHADIALIATRRSRRIFKIRDIIPACHQIPLFIFPDASALRMRRCFPRIATCIDLLFFIFSVPFLARKAKSQSIERVFVLCGADGTWLIAVKILQLGGLPVDLYVVDDVERFAEMNHQILKHFMPQLFRHVAQRCHKVFAISPGYAEQIQNEHGIVAEWLPVPIAEEPHISENHGRYNHSKRIIVYSGAINHLYKDAITDLYNEIIKHNSNPAREYDLHLNIMSYGDPSQFTKTLQHEQFVSGYRDLPEQERIEMMREGYACFLPYSFEAEERKMVTTSFSCKIIEYFKSGRPIMVYGPAYASIPRYFRDLGLPLCATSREELQQELRRIESVDANELKRRYHAAWERFHSPAAIRSILLQPPIPLTGCRTTKLS